MDRKFEISEQTGKALDCFVDCDRLHGRILELSRDAMGENAEFENSLCDAICKVERLIMEIAYNSIENKISETGNDGEVMLI